MFRASVVAVTLLATACAVGPAKSPARLGPDIYDQEPPTWVATPSVSPTTHVSWRLLATEESGGGLDDAYSVDVATSAQDLRDVWHSHALPGSPPKADFDEVIVAAFGHGHGSSCPDLVLAEVVIDPTAQQVYSRDAVAPTPSDPLGQRPCTADLAGSTIFFVALDRDALPPSPFIVSLTDPDHCSGSSCRQRRVNLAARTPAPTATALPEATGYTVTIAPGLHPKWTAAQAAAAAMRALIGEEEVIGEVLAEPRVLSVAAVLGRDVPADYGGRDSERARDVVWIVECQGSFIQTSFQISPWKGTRGYFVYDDTGGGIGFGADLTIPPPTLSPTD